MLTRACGALLVVAVIATLSACGGDDRPRAVTTAGTSSPPAGAPPVGTVPGAGTTAPAGGSSATPAAGVTPDLSATERAAAAQLGQLGTLVLAQTDVPAGFAQRTNQPAPRSEAARAESGIPKLAIFLNNSSLQGGWAALFTRDDPNAGLSSIVFAFSDPADARKMVELIGGLTTADYGAAVSVERAQADAVGEASTFMRYRLSGARTLEYTWARGRLVGQVILRYAGDIESDGDPGLLVSLARKQDTKMASVR
jgi:hypothetical protein